MNAVKHDDFLRGELSTIRTEINDDEGSVGSGRTSWSSRRRRTIGAAGAVASVFGGSRPASEEEAHEPTPTTPSSSKIKLFGTVEEDVGGNEGEPGGGAGGEGGDLMRSRVISCQSQTAARRSVGRVGADVDVGGRAQERDAYGKGLGRVSESTETC